LENILDSSQNMWCGLCADDIVNQAKDSSAKFIVSSQRCAAKSVGVKDSLPQQIKVVLLCVHFQHNKNCVQ